MIDGAWLVLRAAGLVLALQAAGSALFSVVFGRYLSSARAAVATAGARCAGAALAVALLTRLGGTLCIALAPPAGGPARRRLALIGAAAIIASFALTGHTAVNAWRALLAPLLLTHIAIVTFWFGSLAPLRQVLRLEPAAPAAAAVARFSALAVWLVPLIAVAGIGMALLLLPDAAALRRPYGLMLLTKAALFALLMGLAAVNRLRLAPALARSQAREPLRRTLALEFVLICVVLAVTALLTGRYSPAE
jgi:copper transport protein